MPKVSVIIPCYNQGEFLSEAVHSLFAQTHKNWECIIINDGSTDNSGQIADSLVSDDGRVNCISKQNGGLSSARNAGLRLANGEYIQFLDADDLLEPTKLEVQLKALKAGNGSEVAICDHFPFDHLSGAFTPRMYKSPFIDAGSFKREIISEWEFRKSIPCHNLLIPRDLIVRHGLSFNESLPNHEDWVFWCQVFYYASGICFQYEKLVKYRMRNQSMSSNKEKMAEGFLAATFLLETFYHNIGESDLVRCVRKIRKEVRNNLFPYTPKKQIYASLIRDAKKLFGIS